MEWGAAPAGAGDATRALGAPRDPALRLLRAVREELAGRRKAQTRESAPCGRKRGPGQAARLRSSR